MITYKGTVSLKNIFLSKRNWWRFYIKNKPKIREGIVKAVVKMLSCKDTDARGFSTYKCEKCGHTHTVKDTCKSKFCSSCGKKATEIWLRKAFNTFPPCPWHHITLTMPKQLWELFWLNRPLLGLIMKAAGDTLNQYAENKGKVKIAIFLGLHTFGSALFKNIHIHLSASCFGITHDLTKIKELKFDKIQIMKMWRFRVIKIMRDYYQSGLMKLPKSLSHLKSYQSFNSWLNFLYQKHWIIDISKKLKDHSVTTKYIGKYIKRPAIGDARIVSFDDDNVIYKFKDHHTGLMQQKTVTIDQFIALTIQHIPDFNFRMIRYYGILANRLRGKLLTAFFELLGIQQRSNNTSISWRQMVIYNYHYDPLLCPHCKIEMVLVEAKQSKKNYEILAMHEELAQKVA